MQREAVTTTRNELFVAHLWELCDCEHFVLCVHLHSSVQVFIHHHPHRSTRRRRWGKLTIWKMFLSRDTPAHCTLITCVPPSHVTFTLTLTNVTQIHRCILPSPTLIHTSDRTSHTGCLSFLSLNLLTSFSLRAIITLGQHWFLNNFCTLKLNIDLGECSLFGSLWLRQLILCILHF